MAMIQLLTGYYLCRRMQNLLHVIKLLSRKSRKRSAAFGPALPLTNHEATSSKQRTSHNANTRHLQQQPSGGIVNTINDNNRRRASKKEEEARESLD
eukprot:scaffold17264_cov78-Skeletonema_dohrnii-CCMP3373.AAC.2